MNVKSIYRNIETGEEVEVWEAEPDTPADEAPAGEAAIEAPGPESEA